MVANITLPEARSQTARIADLFTETQQRQHQSPTEQWRDQTAERIARVIRQADDLLGRIPKITTQEPEEVAQLLRVTEGLRAAAYLLMKEFNPDQAWFWTVEWQAKEREADADGAAGRIVHFDNDDALIAYLESLISADANP